MNYECPFCLNNKAKTICHAGMLEPNADDGGTLGSSAIIAAEVSPIYLARVPNTEGMSERKRSLLSRINSLHELFCSNLAHDAAGLRRALESLENFKYYYREVYSRVDMFETRDGVHIADYSGWVCSRPHGHTGNIHIGCTYNRHAAIIFVKTEGCLEFKPLPRDPSYKVSDAGAMLRSKMKELARCARADQ